MSFIYQRFKMEKPHIREINYDCYFRASASSQMCSKKKIYCNQMLLLKSLVLIACIKIFCIHVLHR